MYASNYYPKWNYPNAISQFAEDSSHIPWNSVANFNYLKHRDGSKTHTVAPLKHIPINNTTAVKNKTWFLFCQFVLDVEPGKINGAMVEIDINRESRITDETVQLYLNGERIGDNLASFDTNKTIYGTSWGMNWNTINPVSLKTANFGVLLRYQSHPTIPHSSTPYINFVRMRYTVENEFDKDYQEKRPNIGWTNAWVKGDPSQFTKSFSGAKKTVAGSSGTGEELVSGGESFPTLGSGFEGSGGFTGSQGFGGSQGFMGSFGFIGSGFAGSTGYFGSTANIENYTTIFSRAQLPTTGSYRYQSFFVQTTGELLYWDGEWILYADYG